MSPFRYIDATEMPVVEAPAEMVARVRTLTIRSVIALRDLARVDPIAAVHVELELLRFVLGGGESA